MKIEFPAWIVLYFGFRSNFDVECCWNFVESKQCHVQDSWQNKRMTMKHVYIVPILMRVASFPITPFSSTLVLYGIASWPFFWKKWILLFFRLTCVDTGRFRVIVAFDRHSSRKREYNAFESYCPFSTKIISTMRTRMQIFVPRGSKGISRFLFAAE